MRVPEPVPELSAILHTPGSLRWHRVPMPGHLSSAQITLLSERAESKLCRECFFVSKEVGRDEERRFRSTKNFWELISNALVCYDQ